jgi:hypothetical protein
MYFVPQPICKQVHWQVALASVMARSLALANPNALVYFI